MRKRQRKKNRKAGKHHGMIGDEFPSLFERMEGAMASLEVGVRSIALMRIALRGKKSNDL